MKPTVIGKTPVAPVMEEVKMKPTAINPKKTMTPTKVTCDCGPIGCDNPLDPKCSASQAVHAQPSMKPSTFTSKVPPPSEPTSPMSVRPSKLPGTQRIAMSVSLEEIRKNFLAYDDSIHEEIHKILNGVILEVLDTQNCISFGVGVQHAYSNSVNEWLKVLEGDQIRTTGRHVQRLKEILQTIADSLVATQSWFRRETIQGRFDRVKPEIDQLRGILKVADQKLSDSLHELTKLRSTTQKLIKEATGYMLSCEYLTGKVSDDKARLLTDRGISLGKTIGLLQTQAIKLEQDEQNITSLLSNIQDGVLIALPALLSSVATAVQDEKNDTQRFVIRDQVMDVIRKLT